MKRNLAILLVFVIAFLALGFRIVHPKQGLSSAMGSAHGSLTIYRHTATPTKGEKVIVAVKGLGDELGLVKSTGAGTVDVDTGATFVRVANKDVRGKLIAVIPFLGLPLSWVGL